MSKRKDLHFQFIASLLRAASFTVVIMDRASGRHFWMLGENLFNVAVADWT